MGQRRARKRTTASPGGAGGAKKRSKRGSKGGGDVAEDEVPILVEPGKDRRYKAVDWKSERYYPGDHVVVNDDGEEWVARIERIWANKQGKPYFRYTQYWRPVDIRDKYPAFDFSVPKNHQLHECFVTSFADNATVDIIERKVLVLNWSDFRNIYARLSRQARSKLVDVFFSTRMFYLDLGAPSFKPLSHLLFPGDQVSQVLLRKAGLPSDYFEQPNLVEDDPSQRYNSQDPSAGVSFI